MPYPILICGNNPTLLLTRMLVLEHAGIRVRTIDGVSQLQESTEEHILLCSSLREAEQVEAIRLTRLRQPHAKILVVGEDRFLEDDAVLRMSAFAGAEVLIEKALLLLQ